METISLWNDQVPSKDGVTTPIAGTAFSPDGSRIIVGVGNRVLLYNAETGDLISSVRGHKGIVTSVDFSYDSSMFASSGEDNVVVIWKVTVQGAQGVLKYNHNSKVQCIAYNPTVIQLCSCSNNDFGLWSPDQKQVTKEKVSSKILSVVWAPSGNFVALGLESGQISLWNQQAEEILCIERKSPIWCLAFLPNLDSKATSSSNSNEGDLLVVGCWDKTLSSYKIQ